MLHFFRKYQYYFFLVITVVIVISFTFFGTYSALSTPMNHDTEAFKAVDGKQVMRSEVEQLALFLGTDNDDKILFGGMWGPNFLNDGVIRKDFFETGLAQVLVAEYSQELTSDLQGRHGKEKRYKPYAHPQAQFLSAEAAWEYFVPEKRAHFYKLREAQEATSAEAFDARVQLYLDEKKFPAPTLAKMLRYQEQQFNWITPDPALERQDLSLFGYHTTEDWFGPRFIRLVSQVIINSAKIAQQKGYRVSDAEVLADLLQNSETSYRQMQNNPNLGVANSSEYFNEQLRRYGLEKRQAIKMWKQVMLFRRMFHDRGNSVLVAPLTFEKFNAYAKESVEGDLYRLPEALRLGSVRDLQRFEAYLDAISRRQEGQLKLPTTFLSPLEVAKNTPELVQKRYVLEIAEVNKRDLENRITVKEMWNWQLDEKNWARLVKEFPELKPGTREERFATLQGLDDKTQRRVNAFSRKTMVKAEPAVIEAALDQAEPKQMRITLRMKGGTSPFRGLKDRTELMRLLDQAPLKNRETANTTPEILQKQSAKKLAKFTGDNETYYRIVVVEKAPALEIITFEEAKAADVLDSVLKAHEQDSENLLAAIRKDFLAHNPKFSEEQLTPDLTASLRFYSVAREALKNAHKKAETAATPLQAQWQLQKTEVSVERGQPGQILNKDEAFALEAGEWSTINTFPNGDLYFFQLKERSGADQAILSEQVAKAKPLLSHDAQQLLMRHLLEEIQKKGALSLDYYNRGNDEHAS